MFSCKSKGSVKINGRTFTGNVQIVNGQIFQDGVNVNNPGDQKEYVFNISVDGNVSHLESTAGNVTVNGNVENLRTVSGDVNVGGNVGGNVSTVSGDVFAGRIMGETETVSGDITSGGL